MGIEAIGSAVGGIASAVGREASSVGQMSAEVGPAVGSIGRIVNEGPVGLADLKNTMPLQLGQTNPVSELRFNEPVKGVGNLESLSVESAVAEAESIISQVFRPSAREVDTSTRSNLPLINEIATLPLVARNDRLVESAPLEITRPRIQTVIEQAGTVAQSAWEAHPITQAEQIVQQLDKQEPATLPITSEEIEEVLVKEEVKQIKTNEIEEERIEEDQQNYLEDEEVSAQRKHEIREAVIKARSEADRLGFKKIAGWLVAKFLPPEHVGNRSRIVKETGPDGSYQEMVEAIAGTGEFGSEGKAAKRFDEIVAEKKPVKIGKNGTPVGNGDVARVFKYHFFKPVQPHLEVVERIVKKRCNSRFNQVRYLYSRKLKNLKQNQT